MARNNVGGGYRRNALSWTPKRETPRDKARRARDLHLGQTYQAPCWRMRVSARNSISLLAGAYSGVGQKTLMVTLMVTIGNITLSISVYNGGVLWTATFVDPLDGAVVQVERKQSERTKKYGDNDEAVLRVNFQRAAKRLRPRADWAPVIDFTDRLFEAMVLIDAVSTDAAPLGMSDRMVIAFDALADDIGTASHPPPPKEAGGMRKLNHQKVYGTHIYVSGLSVEHPVAHRALTAGGTAYVDNVQLYVNPLSGPFELK